MSRKCVCQICKKQLTTDKAYKVRINDKNKYYCTEEEYNEFQSQKTHRDRCYEYISECMRVKFVTPFIKKEINKLKEYYDYNIIERCFKDNLKTINWFLDNNENSMEFGKCRYVFTIIQNNINSTYKKFKEEMRQKEILFKVDNNMDIDIINNIECKTIDKNDALDISDFFEGDF